MQCNTMIIERVIEYDKVGFIKSSQKFRNISILSLLCSQRLHLFNQYSNNSNIVEYYFK